MSSALVLATLSLAVWLYLTLHRGFFWLARLPGPVARPRQWPSVVAVVPARNEAAVVGEAVRSLLQQNYPGRFAVVLVDDHSDDGTAVIAERAAAWIGKADRLTVLSARPLPPGWAGKLWALSEGVRHAEAGDDPPDLLLFTDADIAHHAPTSPSWWRASKPRGAISCR
jgi:cellulose synthase/poly-beta-1,6-N-acetylglucosamine synthase-like glycosyltransferase